MQRKYKTRFQPYLYAYPEIDDANFKDTLTIDYKALVRPHLEYANVIWHPTKIKDITAIENVQRQVTKYLPLLKNLSFEERLQKL